MEIDNLTIDSLSLPSRVELIDPDSETTIHAFHALQAGMWVWDVRQQLFSIDERYVRNLGYEPASAPKTFDD